MTTTNHRLGMAAAGIFALTVCWVSGASAGSISGSGSTSKGEAVTAVATTKSDGTVVVSVSPPGLVCTSVIHDPEDRSRGDLVCSDGKNGTLVLRLRKNGKVRAIAYFRGMAGSGSVNFR